MANRNTRNKLVPEPLFNYSQRPTASHQITASQTSAIGQTHVNYRTSGLNAPLPLPDEPEAMVLDDPEMPELMDRTESEDEDDEDEAVDEMPQIRVVAKKLPAKRYINSVCCITYSLVPKSDEFDRIRPWKRG